MFDVAPTELLLVVLVALVVIGPKDLPKAMRFVGNWVGKARGMARHFRSGLDTMMREAELEELEKKWREQNESIMREFPRVDGDMTATPPQVTDAATAADDAQGGPEKTEAEKDAEAAATKPETHEIPPRDGPLP